MTVRPRVASLVLVGALVAAACGTSIPEVETAAVPTPEPTPSPTPVPTATAVPTATPIPTPSPTATPTPTPTPVFEIKPELAARLPDGWTGELVVDLSSANSAEPPAGGIVGPVVPNPSRWQYGAVLGRLGPNQRVVVAAADRIEAVEGIAPLTGLAADELTGRAVVVKIDNVPRARPQTGINQADVLYEELVESGVSRFAAVFHSVVPTVVGPVRSGRSTDIGIIASFNTPVFAFSGANSIFERLIDKQQIVNRGAEVAGGYWRSGARAAPHNMYTSASDQQAAGGDGEAPLPHFAYADAPTAPAVGAEATTIRLRYLAGAGPAIEFRWDADVGGWLRWQNGTRHVDTDGVQLAPRNVVVQFVEYLDAGMTDKFGEVLYEGVSVGEGPALIFTDGHVVEATWTRSRLKDPTTFTDADGAHIELGPGQTFVSLIAPEGATWE
ncbi:MAG: DUF3048 domain-containing protein [Actinomycetota bacterium]